MKKLFVLFLLVALVPFTVGCGLFGDNDDTTPVNVTKLTASALLPDSAGGQSLRAAATVASKFKGYTMTINDVELTAETEENTGNGWNVTFSRVITTAEYEKAKRGVVPVVIKTGASKVAIVTIYVNTSNLTTTSSSSTSTSAPLTITVTTSGSGFSAGDVVVGGETVTPTTTPPATINITTKAGGLKPAFNAAFSADIFAGITDIASAISTGKIVVDVDVRKAGSTFRDASANDFTYSYANNTLTVNLVSRSLTAGQSYEVAVRSIKVDGVEKVQSTAYPFTATAQ